MVRTPMVGANYIKQMHLDTIYNILVCRMKSGIIYFVKLFQAPKEKNAFLLEMMQHYQPVKNEKNQEQISTF